MSGLAAALGGMIAAGGVGMVTVARSWPIPSGERRARRLVSDASLLDDLLGPPSAYTAFEHAPGVIRQGFHDCPTCDQTTAGVLTRDGWTCGQCLQPVHAIGGNR
ncbi:hypothetical protein PYK79_41360 [Streptomyces sp. ID05-04B]|uniref:hypothetical protein n=1 Tax=Streptomyces sp. ID05-04B TaxID=3028661 RepID=UPI0029C58188|nr:hypothetical protein [Streptomyces sp. ID05-04B]MDX5568453.1 hypothetical protein [Streptomyces sp. ID05-04B]